MNAPALRVRQLPGLGWVLARAFLPRRWCWAAPVVALAYLLVLTPYYYGGLLAGEPGRAVLLLRWPGRSPRWARGLVVAFTPLVVVVLAFDVLVDVLSSPVVVFDVALGVGAGGVLAVVIAGRRAYRPVALRAAVAALGSELVWVETLAAWPAGAGAGRRLLAELLAAADGAGLAVAAVSGHPANHSFYASLGFGVAATVPLTAWQGRGRSFTLFLRPPPTR